MLVLLFRPAKKLETVRESSRSPRSSQKICQRSGRSGRLYGNHWIASIVPIVPNTRSHSWGAWICQPSLGAKRFQNGGKKSQSRTCCNIFNCIGSYTPKERKEITKKAPTWTWPYILLLLRKSPVCSANNFAFIFCFRSVNTENFTSFFQQFSTLKF